MNIYSILFNSKVTDENFNLKMLKKPSKKILLAEGGTFGISTFIPMLADDEGYAAYRHTNRMNIMYVDGHLEQWSTTDPRDTTTIYKFFDVSH